MTALPDLIARLESATEPSREMDCLIAAEFGIMSDFNPANHTKPITYAVSNDGKYVEAWIGPRHRWANCVCSRDPARFTASIDAALTLAPEGANSHGYDLSPSGVEAYFSRNHVSTGRWMELSSHPTLIAVAFCIAAMRRKLAVEQQS